MTADRTDLEAYRFKAETAFRPNAVSHRSISRRVAGELVMGLDFLIIVLAACISPILTDAIGRPTYLGLPHFLGIGMFGGATAVGLLALAQMYRFEQFFVLQSQIMPIFTRWSLAILILMSAAFLTGTSETYSRLWVLTWYTLALGGLMISRPIIRSAFRKHSREGGILGRHIALVGANDLSRRFNQIASRSGSGLSIVGLFDDRGARRDAKGDDLPIAGTIEDLIDLAQRGRVDEIVVTLPWSAEARVSEIVQRLSVLPVSVRLCPDQVGLHFMDRDYDTVAGIKVLEANPRPLDGWGGIFKAVEDRVLAALALVVLFPLFLVVALAIKLESPGPVFFKQRRHGFNHKVFYIYKFRSMRTHDDGGTVRQATRHDARVTRVGWFLRRTSIDELPQLINVVRGEMSLVGPRPHAVAHNDEYSKLISDYAKRHRVKPGITGWAQVNGYRGQTETPQKMAARVAHDLYYIENWSPLLDLKILILTVVAILFPRNAF